jgi:hypothetical protein
MSEPIIPSNLFPEMRLCTPPSAASILGVTADISARGQILSGSLRLAGSQRGRSLKDGSSASYACALVLSRNA